MDLTEGVGESSSPPRSFGNFSNYDVRNAVYNRLMESGHNEAVSNPELFRELLNVHFNRLPPSYGLDINMDRVEDVLLHQRLLTSAKDPEKRPVYHIRFLENLCTRKEDVDDQQFMNIISIERPDFDADNGVVKSNKRIRDCTIDFEPCSKLEDLNLDVRRNSKGLEEMYHGENVSRRQEFVHVPIHEVIFSTIDKPKLLSQDTDGLYKAMEKAISGSEGSWSGSSHFHSSVDKASAAHAKSGDWEIDGRLLKIAERIASGSCGDLYHGVYLGQDVAVKILISEHLNDRKEEEFAKEVAILRQVQHRNAVRFIGACTHSPHLCIVTGRQFPA
ncbi:hypothetical protein GH714_020746 [Hevea brasiliensis]|uniref:non-specific serine/threonine protein kinase n=1 Tax=Hevea brasiliensis TaxID=3981 RepID=A0A6A6KRH8_HEVBR|nr:hypothetical protein GH714_020746 [Hevea brasiliensis]